MSTDDVHARREQLRAEIAAVRLEMEGLAEELRILQADADLADSRAKWIAAAQMRRRLLQGHVRHLLERAAELARESPGE